VRLPFVAPAFACAGLALALIAYRRFGPRLGLDTAWVLDKEGALENFTFIAEFVSAALLLVAARWLFKTRVAFDKSLGFAYVLAGALLFIVGMEEIGWGQQLFHFGTPEQWAAINHQQETTLHNLLEHEMLTESARWMAYGFAFIALLASTPFFRKLHPLLGALAPHGSLVPMALVIGISGFISHPEIIELFMASYALVYSYQSFSRTRSYASGSAHRDVENWTTEPRVAHPIEGAGRRRILVTGASGFIGSRLCCYAREQGYDVVATGLARNATERERLEEVRRRGMIVHVGSLQDAAFVERVLEDFDAVIHLAAAQHEANVPDQYFVDVNVGATRVLLDACARKHVKRFVYGSSIGVYGEASGPALSETSVLNPQNAYGKSKALAEKAVLEFADRIAVTITRISETYGPGDFRLLKLFNAVANGTYVKLGRGDNRRQPIHVRDLCRALLLAAEHPNAIGQTFVLAGCQVLTTSDVVDAIAAAVGARRRVRSLPLAPFMLAATLLEQALRPLGVQPPLHRRRLDFFTKSFWFDTSKAKTVLGFEPSIPFAHGAAETAHWYRNKGLIKSAAPVDAADIEAQPGVPLDSSPGRPWQYSEILEFTHDAIIIWEMDGRGIVYWNRAAEQLYGFHRSESLGRVTHTLLQTKANLDIADIETQLARLGVWSGELQHIAKNGRIVHVQARLALMGQQNGRWLVLEVNRDLTLLPANVGSGTAAIPV
jgi:PAS domain S-box-containing protein